MTLVCLRPGQTPQPISNPVKMTNFKQFIKIEIESLDSMIESILPKEGGTI